MASGIPSAALSGSLPPLAAEPGLFDPTAPLDAQGAPKVWGVDGSSKRVSIAMDGLPPMWRTKSFSRPPVGALEPHHLAIIYAETLELARGLAADVGLPELIVIEQPTGAHPSLPLVYAVGCSIAALGALGVRMEFIPVSSWKSRSVGHGFAKKPQILEWARRRGYTGRLEDEADALGIAVGGASLFGVG